MLLNHSGIIQIFDMCREKLLFPHKVPCTKIPLPARDWYPKKGMDGVSNDICPGPKLGKYMRDTLCS